MLGKWWDPETSPKAYPDPFDAFADATRDPGRRRSASSPRSAARYVQIDATDIATLADPDVRAQYDGLGIGAERMLGEGIDDARRASPPAAAPDVTMGIHLCKGNSEGRFIAAGAYERDRGRVFPRLDALRRAAARVRRRALRRLRAARRETRDDHVVVLGLVSSKTPAVETDDEIVARIEEAAAFVPHGAPGAVLPVRVRVDGRRQQDHAGGPAREARARGQGRRPRLGRARGGSHVDFGLGLMGYEGSWDDARFAEEHGFSTVGFVDSPLLGGRSVRLRSG